MKNRSIILLIDKEFKYYTSISYSFFRGFEANGYKCTIVSFCVNIFLYKILNNIPPLQKLYLLFHQRNVIKAIKGSNSKLVFVVKGYYLMPDTIEKIKTLGKVIVCFNPDDPFNKDFGSSSPYTIQCIKHYNAYFIWHNKLIDKLKQNGCKNAFYIPFAADLEIIKPSSGAFNGKYQYDVSFIGNADKERINMIKDISILLKAHNNLKMSVFGNGWKYIKELNSENLIEGDVYLKTMHSTKININILRNQNKDAHNMRTFEIPAAGGFMLHELSEDVTVFFEAGVEADYFRDAKECAEKIVYYLDNYTKREQIAKAGYEKVISSDYTYSGISKRIMELTAPLNP